MPNSRSKGTTRKRKSTTTVDKRLSARTKKQIDSLPKHAQLIYKNANALEQYQNPEKRRGGKKQSAHKASWAAVKRDYTKKGDK
jgi:cation transport regulator